MTSPLPPIGHRTERRKAGGDKPPALVMMAAAESGRSVGEFLELPSHEFDWWTDFVLGGASTMRTQLLLMQLIQIVGSALGSKNNKPETILPYFTDVFNIEPKDIKAAMRRNVKGAVEDILDKRLKAKKDG